MRSSVTEGAQSGRQRPLHRFAVPLPRFTGKDEGCGADHAAPPMCVTPPI
jgi:hypothetical protein